MSQLAIDFLSGYRDGKTFDPERDEARLNRQALTVWNLMADSAWRTLSEISKNTGEPEASISARLRDFRKEKFGGHAVERRRRTEGTYEYRLLINGRKAA